MPLELAAKQQPPVVQTWLEGARSLPHVLRDEVAAAHPDAVACATCRLTKASVLSYIDSEAIRSLLSICPKGKDRCGED
jgi:hypothetical protein